MRETTLKIGLEPEGSALHVPRTVVDLSVEEELQAALIGWIGRGQAACLAQRDHCLPGRECVARHLRQLRPAAIRALPLKQQSCRFLQFLRSSTRPVQAKKLEHA